jgi:D-glycero-alpha-D-manno-heptose 1-phosphate guanylyltransferase
MEAVILAGGLGTRLGDLTKNTPKPMLSVAGRPFIEYLLQALDRSGVDRVVLSVGHLANLVSSRLGTRFGRMQLEYAVEHEQLGTGGGILNGLRCCRESDVMILNGDSYVEADHGDMLRRHRDADAVVTMCVCEVENPERYGKVQTEQDRVVRFMEKGAVASGLINAGLYVVNRDSLQRYSLPRRFSFEKDFLERYVDEIKPVAYCATGQFIDIGIPADYARAQSMFAA